MIGEEIKKKLIDIVSDMKIDPYEGITRVRLFSNLFGEFPSLYNIIKCDDGETINVVNVPAFVTKVDVENKKIFVNRIKGM